MNKKLLIIISGIVSVLLILGIAILSFYQRSHNSGGLKTAEDVFSQQNKGKTVQDDKILMPVQGGSISINNVFKSAERTSSSNYLSYKISDGIEYTAGGGGDGFIITGSNSVSLSSLEQKFINLLGINNADACKLDVQEYVTASPTAPSFIRNSLSFCATDITSNEQLSVPAENVFYVKTKQGERIQVANFYKSAAKIGDGFVNIVNNKFFSIDYYPSFDTFYINSVSSDSKYFGDVASQAVVDLEKQLKISQAQLCSLPVLVVSGVKSPDAPTPVPLSSLVSCK